MIIDVELNKREGNCRNVEQYGRVKHIYPYREVLYIQYCRRRGGGEKEEEGFVLKWRGERGKEKGERRKERGEIKG